MKEMQDRYEAEMRELRLRMEKDKEAACVKEREER